MKKKGKENCGKALELIDLGRDEEAQKLTQEDVGVYCYVCAEAQKKEKAGKPEEAAELYWTNISSNGTIAPANFYRLLSILKKLGRLQEESKVSEIYDHLF